MAVIADYRLPSGCRVRIHDDFMDKTPEGRARVWNAFWSIVDESLRRQLDSGVPYEELKTRICRANAEAEERAAKVARARHETEMVSLVCERDVVEVAVNIEHKKL